MSFIKTYPVADLKGPISDINIFLRFSYKKCTYLFHKTKDNIYEGTQFNQETLYTYASQ